MQISGPCVKMGARKTVSEYGEIEYRYDASGIRQEKQIGNVLHKYYTDGSRIYKEERGNEVLWYHYDNTGVTGLEHNGKKYYFQKNIQGDVVRIFDEAGSLKASYIYDAWGNHRVIDGMTGMDVTHDFTIGGVTTDVSRHIGNINSFRYRGYYFDRETGLYYLNSRYYDPAICRFINADDARVSEQYVYTLNGLNLYSYCLNNPITHTDENGHVIGWIIGIALALGGLLLSADALIKAISAYQRNSTGANLFQLIVSSIFFVIDLVLFIFSVIKLVQAIKAAKSFVSATQAIQGADDAVVNSVDDVISPNWPPNDGFMGPSEIKTLEPGTLIDRYGPLNGYFAAPAGTPFEMRSLPADYINKPLYTFEVIKPIQVHAGITAPWFGQPGLGIQYKFFDQIMNLWDYLRIVSF